MEESSALNVDDSTDKMIIISPQKDEEIGITDEQIAGLKRLTMRLYCLPYSEEFRQPVQVKYPDLLEEYMSVIRTPSDLGTILIKLKNRSYKTVTECGNDLNLCFQNAIKFNATLSNLVSISNHLLSFTANLWHAIIRTPFSLATKKPSSSSSTNSQKLYQQMIKNRQIHFEETKMMSLTLDEIQVFSDGLQSLDNVLIKKSSLGNAFKTVMATCTTLLQEENHSNNNPSLSELLLPIIDEMKIKFPTLSDKSEDNTHEEEEENNNSNSSEILHSCLLGIISSDKSIYPMEFSFEKNELLNQFEYVLEEITAVLFERCTRGFDMSAIWINYSRVVWAQPNSGQPQKSHGSKRVAWWPGVVIGGAGISSVQENINVSRIPKTLKNALAKLRPKSKDCASLNGDFVGTDQLCLIEYFGSHDFGWCRTDVMQPYIPGQKFKLSDEKKEAGFSESVTKDTYAIEEANGSFEYLKAALEAGNFHPEDNFLVDLEEQISNLPSRIQYVTPAPKKTVTPATTTTTTTAAESKSKKRSSSGAATTASSSAGTSSSSSSGNKSKGGNKRRKKVEETPETFTFTMYPSEWEDLPPRGNKRQFALWKTISLCKYAQGKNELLPQIGRGRGYFNRENSKAKIEQEVRKQANEEVGEFVPSKELEEENISVGMCFAGISESSTDNKSNGKIDTEKSMKSSISGGQKSDSNRDGSDGNAGGDVEKKEAPKYTPKVLTFAGQTFAASVGCTQVVRNKALSFVPVLHTRKIAHNAPVFFLEAPTCEERKELLREEIKRLKGQLEDLSVWVELADNLNAKRNKEKLNRQEYAKKLAARIETSGISDRSNGGDGGVNRRKSVSNERNRNRGSLIGAGGSKIRDTKKGLLSSTSNYAVAERGEVGKTKKEKRKYVFKNIVGDERDDSIDDKVDEAVDDDNVDGDDRDGETRVVSRGKAQQEEAERKNTATIMSSSYEKTSSTSKKKRRRDDSDTPSQENDTAEDTKNDDNDEDEKESQEPVAKTAKKSGDKKSKAVVSQTPPKPFVFNSVMNMMPSF